MLASSLTTHTARKSTAEESKPASSIWRPIGLQPSLLTPNHQMRAAVATRTRSGARGWNAQAADQSPLNR